MKKIFFIITALLSASLAVAQFEGNFIMSIKNEKDKEPVKFKITRQGDFSAMEFISVKQGGMKKTIFNKNEGTMIMLMENGVGMRMQVNTKEPMNTEKTDAAKITVTRETKIIEGYTCTKVITETVDYASESWVTKELDMTMADIMGIFKSKGQRSPMGKMDSAYDRIDGVALESVTTNNKTKEKTMMTIHDINRGQVSAEVFSTEGYTIMDAPVMGR